MAKRNQKKAQAHPQYTFEIDWAQAERFISLLHNGNSTEFRFIRDQHVLRKWGDLQDATKQPGAPELRDLQKLNQTGYNAYAVVNYADPQIGHSKIINPPDDQKPKAIADADITRINALFVDIDRPENREGEILDQLQNAALEPSLIVQSSSINKLHAYWLVADCPPELFERLVVQLIAIFQADPVIKNLSRIMRIPGFYHVKSEPIRTQIIDDPGHVYTLAEIVEAFDLDTEYELYAERKQDVDYEPQPGIAGRILAVAKKRVTKVIETDVGRRKTLLWLALSCRENELPQDEADQLASTIAGMLPERSDGTGMVPAEEAIDIVTWAYAKSAGGTPWPPIPSKASIPGVVTVTTPEPDPESPDDTPTPAATAAEYDFLSPTAKAPITIQNSGYARVTEKTTRQGETLQTFDQLTNWTFTPTVTLTYPDRTLGMRGTLAINTKERYEIDLPAKAWAGRRELLNHIGGHNASMFTNSAADVSFIHQFILTSYQDLPVATGTDTYGLHKLKGAWTLLFEDTQNPELFYSGTPVDPGSPGFRTPKQGTPDEIAEARLSIRDLPHLISSHAGFAITGYAIASAFSPRITPLLGDRIPFLYTTGERESGKSSSIEFALNMTSGTTSRLHKAPGMTAYQYDVAFSSNNNRLAALDEYRPGAIDDAQLRKHHDLATKYRGSGLASKDHSYPLNVPLIVSGEGFTEDAAALSRGVLFFIEKKDRGNPDRFLKAQARPLWAYAHHLHQAAKNTPESVHLARFNKARTLAKQATGTRGGPRMQFALTYIAYGLLYAQTDIDANYYSDEVIHRVLEVGVTQTLDGGSESKTNLETFLEQLGSAAGEAKDPEGIVTPAVPDHEIIIRISPAVELVKRRYGTEAAISNPRLLRRYAEAADWVDDGISHRNVDNELVRGIRLSLKNVPEACDASALAYLERKLRATHR